MSRQPEAAGLTHEWTIARTGAGLIGSVFLALGVLGFIPGITANYEQFSVAGPGPAAELFGLFTASVVLNSIRLVFGIAGLIMALVPAAGGVRVFLVPGGGVMVLFAVYGAVMTTVSPDVNVVPVGAADNWLHLGLGAAMIGLGILSAALQRRHGH